MATRREFDYDVCIVGLKCWDLITGAESPKYLGGIESDLVTLARLLASEGLRVALIVYDEGQPAVVDVDGISVCRCFSESAGLPLLRFLIPRATGILRTISRVRSRYVLQMGAGVETGWSAIATKWLARGRKFLFLVGSDTDCMASLPRIDKLRERVVYRIGLKLADRVVAQTDAQAALLKSEFDISAAILRLPNTFRSEMSSSSEQNISPPPRNESGFRILWVGRTDANKRPHWMLELASAYPEHRIDIVGAANIDDSYSRQFREDAARFDNVALHGKVPRGELARLYGSADVLCCTSEFEGFPTTFLEAWSYGLPTVSTVDPGQYLSRYKAGSTVASIEEFLAAVSPKSLMRSGDAWSENAEQLYDEHFSPQACLRRFTEVLGDVAPEQAVDTRA